MEKTKIVALMIVAAFVGEAVGVVRGNRHWRPQYEVLWNQNRRTKLCAEAMARTLDNINVGMPVEEAFEKFNVDRAYIDIVAQEV